MPHARSLSTVFATHDRDVATALSDLIVELKDELDAIILTGDIATTSAKPALDEACNWLKNTAAMTGNKRVIALPGNHDRFHPLPPWTPGALAFDRALAVHPAITLAAPAHGVGTLALDDSCLLVCVDLTLRNRAEVPPSGSSLAQGIVRCATDVTDAVTAARTDKTTHVVVATHFPLDPLAAKIKQHECINGPALRAELLRLAQTLPVLLVSGHLHRESHYRDGDLFTLVGATAAQALHPTHEAVARPRNLALPGAHAAITVRTEPGGFVVTRWRYGEDPTLNQAPPAKRFCEPTELRF